MRRRWARERSVLWISSRSSMNTPWRAFPSPVSVPGTSSPADRPTPHHEVGVLSGVKDRRLPRGHGPLGVIEAQADPALAPRVQSGQGGRLGVAYLCQDPPWGSQTIHRDEV